MVDSPTYGQSRLRRHWMMLSVSAAGAGCGMAFTHEDVARGYRVADDDDGGAIVPMPDGAVTNEPLRRRGGFDWVFRVEPEGWRFPYRDGFLDGVTVLARGEVRPDVGTRYFPVPVTNGVSLLPEARWGLLPNGGASVFSHAATTNGSLLLDWRNALVGRDPNCPTNLQLELFRDGRFVWRTDDASRLYLPVFPFDWDGDGLENSVDPEPLSPNAVDAHGTNAEWYRIVCSNVFEEAEGVITFRPDVNSNAYYFVEAVAEYGPAPIHFTADGVSDLGDPAVVALADATNRVPLLLCTSTGGAVSPETSVAVAAGQTYVRRYVCEGLAASDEEDDIKVEGTFIEEGTGEELNALDSATVVEVEIKPQVLAPANRSDHRHTFGVYELVDLIHRPSIDAVEWTLQGGGNTEDSVEGNVEVGIGGVYMLRCPLYDNGAVLKVSCGDCDYLPNISFVEPSGIVAYNPRPAGPPDDIPRGIVGCAMWIDLYVVPMDVSFARISVEEIPSTSSTYSGYFLHSYPPDKRSHNTFTGAGDWIEIKNRNPNDVNGDRGNFFMTDTATTGFLLGVNEYGEMSWAIPVGWHRKPSPPKGTLPFREFAQGQYWHDFKVWPNGDAWVRKHQNELLRHSYDGDL